MRCTKKLIRYVPSRCSKCAQSILCTPTSLPPLPLRPLPKLRRGETSVFSSFAIRLQALFLLIPRSCALILLWMRLRHPLSAGTSCEGKIPGALIRSPHRRARAKSKAPNVVRRSLRFCSASSYRSLLNTTPNRLRIA